MYYKLFVYNVRCEDKIEIFTYINKISTLKIKIIYYF